MRIWGPLPLVGIAKGADTLVVEFHAGGRDDQTSRSPLQPLVRNWFDSQRGPVGSDLHCAGAQAQPIPEYLWNNQASCLVNGCPHATRIPLSWRSRLGRLLPSDTTATTGDRCGAAISDPAADASACRSLFVEVLTLPADGSTLGLPRLRQLAKGGVITFGVVRSLLAQSLPELLKHDR